MLTKPAGGAGDIQDQINQQRQNKDAKKIASRKHLGALFVENLFFFKPPFVRSITNGQGCILCNIRVKFTLFLRV